LGGAALAALLAAAILAAVAQAQTAPDTLKACYVNGSGTVYRTGTENAPATCRKASHVPFQWVDGAGGTPGVTVVTATGSGLNPTSVLNFIGPAVSVMLASNATVLVTSHKAVGSIRSTGGTGLNLDICYRPAGGSPVQVGIGMNALRVPQNTRVGQSLSTTLALPAGTYDVGMCGSSTNFSSWNDNGGGITTAVIFPGS
jgi:hypothetical protein